MNLVSFSDGGSRGNPGNAGIGADIYEVDVLDENIYQNRSGLKMVKELSIGVGSTTNNQAEWKGVIEAMKWIVANYKMADVIFYLDSELVVKQINGVYKVKKAELKPYYHELKKMEYEQIGKAKYLHIRREYNSRADELANQAMDRQE